MCLIMNNFPVFVALYRKRKYLLIFWNYRLKACLYDFPPWVFRLFNFKHLLRPSLDSDVIRVWSEYNNVEQGHDKELVSMSE